MVTVSSKAILQILRYIGDAERIADELETGSIPEKYQAVEEVEETTEGEEAVETEEVSGK